MTLRRNVLIASVLAIVLVCVFNTVASAAAGALVDTVAKWDHRIEVWNRYYYLSLFLVVAVAALGAISGMLQKSSASTWKTAAMLCAYGVTIITVVVNAASVMDYREIKKAIDNADRKVTQLNMLIEKARLKEKDIAYQMAIIEQAQGLIGELHDIQTKVNLGSTMEFDFIKTAHAAPPGWVGDSQKKSSAKDILQFVGTGQDRDLAKARDKAGANFLEQIEDYIVKNIDAVVKRSTITAAKQDSVTATAKSRAKDLAKKIAGNIKEQEAYFEEVKENGRASYRYYLLYKVAPEFLHETLRLQISIFE